MWRRTNKKQKNNFETLEISIINDTRRNRNSKKATKRGEPMMTHKELKGKALSNPKVRGIYENSGIEMELLDIFLKARKITGLTQDEIARRMKTSRPVVARIESGGQKHSPSIRTLQKYASAVGFRLKIDLVPDHGKRVHTGIM